MKSCLIALSCLLPLAAVPAGLHFRVVADKRIEPRSAKEFTVGKNLLLRLPAEPLLRDANGAKELLLPVRGAFTIEYHLPAKP